MGRPKAQQPELNLSFADSSAQQLKLTSVRSRELVDQVAQDLRNLGVDPIEILSTYQAGYLDWAMPPVTLPDELFGGEYPYQRPKKADLVALHKAYREDVIQLAKDGDMRALETYVTRLVVHLRSTVAYKRCTFNGNSVYIEFSTIPPIGIKDGKILGTPVWDIIGVRSAVLDIEAMAQMSGNFVRAETFDALDRAKLWLTQNWQIVPNYELLELKLSVLKLQGDKAGYDFEQALHKPLVEVKSAISGLFTNEALDAIRESWTTEAETFEDKFRRLYDLVIDKFIDSKLWKEFFGVFPPEAGVELPLGRRKKIEGGIERFTNYYLNKQRQIREGKL